MHRPRLEPLESDLLKVVRLLNVFDPVPYLDGCEIVVACFDRCGYSKEFMALRR